MQILFLLFAFVAVVLGFVGLIVIIKGFVDKSNKKIWIGTVLVTMMLILGVLGAFYVSKRALDSKRYHEKQRLMRDKKCGGNCNYDAFKPCCPGDTSACGDSTEVQVIVEKKCCKEKAGAPCPHHMN